MKLLKFYTVLANTMKAQAEKFDARRIARIYKIYNAYILTATKMEAEAKVIREKADEIMNMK